MSDLKAKVFALEGCAPASLFKHGDGVSVYCRYYALQVPPSCMKFWGIGQLRYLLDRFGSVVAECLCPGRRCSGRAPHSHSYQDNEKIMKRRIAAATVAVGRSSR